MHLLVEDLPARLLVQLVQARRVLSARSQVEERVELEAELECIPFANVLLHDGEGGV